MKTNQRWIMPAAVVLLIALAGIRAWPQSQQTTVGLAVGWGALILHNDTDEGVYFLDGAVRMKNLNGKQYVNPGESAIFQLAALNPVRAYTNLSIEFDSTYRLRFVSIDIRPWALYELTISKLNNVFTCDLRESQLFKDSEELERHLESSGIQTQSQQATDILDDEWGVLRIRNDTNEGVVLFDGMKEMRDLNGKMVVSPGEIASFTLEALDSGRSYTNLNLEFDSRSRLRLGLIVVRSLVLYELTISKRNGSFIYDLRESRRFSDSEELETYLEPKGVQTR